MASPKICSGAMYGSVPVVVMLCVALAVEAMRARPKSTIFTTFSLVTITLEGLVSRCTMLRACAEANPLAICIAMLTDSLTGNSPRAIFCASVSPS